MTPAFIRQTENVAMKKTAFKRNDYVKVPDRFGDYEYQIERIHQDRTATLICVSLGLYGNKSRIEISRLHFLDFSK